MSADAAGEATTLHVRRSREGDLESLAWLVERFTPLLLAQARHRIGPPLHPFYDPEDLVQEAWAVLLPRLGDLRPHEGRLTPVLLRFLSTTVLRTHATWMRARLRAGNAPAGAGPSDDLARLGAEQTSIVERAARSEACAIVLRAIDELTEEERDVVVLRGIEHVTVATAAEILGVTKNALCVRYHRALRRLRERLPAELLADLAHS